MMGLRVPHMIYINQIKMYVQDIIIIYIGQSRFLLNVINMDVE